MSTDDKEKGCDAVLGAIKTLTEVYDPRCCSAEIATHVHRTVYQKLGDKDPYEQLKEESNRVALSLLPRVKKVVAEDEDPLKAAIQCSIVGNILDFGIEGGSDSPENLLEVFDRFYSEGLGYSDYLRVRNLLSKADKVVLVADNCGEIVFDKILCRELKRFNPKMFLTFVVRGKPILSDATLEDAEKFGFKDVVDEIQTTGVFAVGLDLRRIPEELTCALGNADIILCKGMANYEVFSETSYKPIAYLLRIKCSAIARSMKLPLHVNAIKLYER